MRPVSALAMLVMTLSGTTLAIADDGKSVAAASPTAAKGVGALDLSAPLPWDPSLVRGTLPNGLTYIIRKHANPEGRSSVWLHVSSGSLNERDEQQGIAHYLEHMAFNGSKNFPPGTVINYFQEMGLQFGRDQNAFTSFDQTTYQLALPDAKPETIARGLLFMSDVGGRLLLRKDEIESERGIIQEEKRTRAGAQQRITDYVLPRMAPEATIGRRLPIGIDETIANMQKPLFDDYYSTWYVPSNMTVIAVADADPKLVIEQIEKAFGDLPKKPKPADLPTGLVATKGMRAIVASDPDLKSADVTIQRMEPPRPPTTTVGQLRDEIIDSMGAAALNRRMRNMFSKGELTVRGAAARVSDFANAARSISIEGSGEPKDWKSSLEQIARELQRARLHGFSEREIADIAAEIMADSEQAAERDGSQPAREVLGRINATIASDEPVMGAAQRVELMKQLLPTISASEVSQRFTSNFDVENVIFIAELPTDTPGGVPSEADLIAAGKAALDVKPPALKEEARAESLLKSKPAPGKVESGALDEVSGVWTGVLSNGASLHIKPMDVQKNEATIVITLAGGTINENASTRGLTEAGSLAWARPATSTLSSTQIRDLMTGKKVNVRGGAGMDTLSISISGSPAELETGLQLAHLMLTDPVIEKAELDQWKKMQLQMVQQRRVMAMGVMIETISDGLYPAGEVRFRPLTKEQIEAVTLEAAQKWIRQQIDAAPIEITVVGDIKAEDVTPLIETYIGSLSTRGPIGPGVFADKRKITRNTGPIEMTRTAQTRQTNQAMVLDGFYGANVRDVKDNRLLQIAARVLSTRMVKIIREEKRLVYSIGASHRPASEVPGFGLFAAQAPTDPAKAADLRKALFEVYSDFAKSGPTAEEMATAKKQFETLFAEQFKDPRYWTQRLTDLNYRGLTLKDLMEAPAFYQNAKAEDVREAFARYFKPESTFSFVIMPEGGGEAPAEKKPETK